MPINLKNVAQIPLINSCTNWRTDYGTKVKLPCVAESIVCRECRIVVMIDG
jgi:flavin reductase (DIM6/NTAB) family NADH-FMN oxidoreductase RutF